MGGHVVHDSGQLEIVVKQIAIFIFGAANINLCLEVVVVAATLLIELKKLPQKLNSLQKAIDFRLGGVGGALDCQGQLHLNLLMDYVTLFIQVIFFVVLFHHFLHFDF